MEKDIKEIVDELKNIAKQNGDVILEKELFRYAAPDSSFYDDLTDALEEAGISIDIEDEEIDVTQYDIFPSDIKVDDPVKMYLKEIGKISLIDRDEELRLGKIIARGVEAQEKLNDQNIQKAEAEILQKQIEESKRAKEKLINANLRLVVSVAKKYTNRGLDLLDLIQEGNMGLMKAVNKFDYTLGNKFSTYATNWIRQAITRGLADQGRTIRLPNHMHETVNKLKKIERNLVQKLSREPAVEEIAVEMGLPVEKVIEIQKFAQDLTSLERKVGEEDDSVLGDFIADDSLENPYEYTQKLKLKEDINSALETLSPRERRILELRHGLIDGKVHTLEEVGNEFNVTRERIRQIENKALRKLKQPGRTASLKEYLEK